MTGNLDNMFVNDFEAGSVNVFNEKNMHNNVGRCMDFNLGSLTSINLDRVIQVYHTGKSYDAYVGFFFYLE